MAVLLHKVIALIPAYNEAGRIGEVVRRTVPLVERVLVVDDGSTDGSGDEARAAGAEVVCHPTNRGKGAALTTGFGRCRQLGCEWVVLLDGDGQHDPEDIPKLLAARDSGGRLLVGNRMEDAGAMPYVRRLGNWLGSLLVSWLCRQRVPDTQCGFRVLHRSLLEVLRLSAERYECDSEMLLLASRARVRIESVPIRSIYAGEKSHIHPIRDVCRLCKLLFRYWRAERRSGQDGVVGHWSGGVLK